MMMMMMIIILILQANGEYTLLTRGRSPGVHMERKDYAEAEHDEEEEEEEDEDEGDEGDEEDQGNEGDEEDEIDEEPSLEENVHDSLHLTSR